MKTGKVKFLNQMNFDFSKHFGRDYLAGLAAQYDEIIDVRTPLEFEEVSMH